jgi:hypothetical protein
MLVSSPLYDSHQTIVTLSVAALMEEYSDGKAQSLQNRCKRISNLEAIPPEALAAQAASKGQQRGKEKEELSK